MKTPNNIPLAVVTGSASGIGYAVAQRLKHDKYHVIYLDVKFNPDINYDGDTYSADISDESAVQKFFAYIKDNFGKIDLLVNNAGIIRDNMIWKMPTDDFDQVIQVNLKGTWLMCKYVSMLMKTQMMGRIVNIASRAWLGNKGQSNYAASKAGVISLTRVLALELGAYNVLVNAIAPGLIDTPLSQGLRPDVLEKLIQAQPTRTMGNPDDVAYAVAFLGSYLNKFITGQTLYVDGGKNIGAGGF